MIRKFKCNKCQVILTEENSYACQIKARIHMCKRCSLRRDIEYAKNHPDIINKKSRKLLSKKRNEIHKLLGRKCIHCGYKGLALQIGHVNDNGAEERKRLNGKLGEYRFILKRIKEGSKDYELTCANCNTEKEMRRRGRI